MGDVYRNSVCTIAASAASSCDAGCFFSRDPRLIEPCKIRNPSSHALEEFYCMDCDIWVREIQDSPLNRRGWVLQELLLSPRTLHFGRNQIFYTCRNLEACEAFPMGLPETIRSGFISRISTELAALTHSYSESIFIWDQTVEYYSQRQLTKGEDKLVAISGLAKDMRLIFNDEYLAGIWRKRGLLWSIFLPYVCDAVRFPGYRAPSWPWDSIDGRILNPIEIGAYIELAEVQEVLVISSVGDSITHINDGFIRLKGRLTTCWYYTKDELLFAELWGLTSTGNQKFEGIVEPDTRGLNNEVVDLYYFLIGLDFTECLLLQSAESKGNFRRFGKFDSRWDRKEGTDIYLATPAISSTLLLKARTCSTRKPKMERNTSLRSFKS
jgi:hypothetical protein